MGKYLGCIGCGNMGSAIIKGFSKVLDAQEWNLCACNRSPEKMLALAKYDVEAISTIPILVEKCDTIIIAVKPYQVAEVLQEAKQFLSSQKTVISMAAGISLEKLRNLAGGKCAIARSMPTTTALVGKGVFAFCFDEVNFTRLNQLAILELFNKLGLCVELPENRFTDFSALIGAGPAYVFEFMHSLMQAGITLGFTKKQSRQMLIQLFSGATELAASQPTSFMELRDDVCSPAGLTISGINVLDRAGFTGLIVDSVLAAAHRGRQMEE